jgi:spermidine synthase
VDLVGQNQAQLLDPQVIARQGRQFVSQQAIEGSFRDEEAIALLLRLYVGNITASGLFEDYPLNTDHYPLIEYLAPQTHRQVQTGSTRFLVGSERERLYDEIRAAVNPEADPYLTNLTPDQHGNVEGSITPAMLSCLPRAMRRRQVLSWQVFRHSLLPMPSEIYRLPGCY